MQEYFGEQAKAFKQTKTKKYMLIPAIEKQILLKKKVTGNFLDLGCGDGYFATIATEHNYKYLGIDISKDMIDLARKNSPNLDFVICSTTEVLEHIPSKFNKFDIILSNMLFPAMADFGDVEKTLSECKYLLSDSGCIICGIPHPSFDGYMQKGLLGRDDVNTSYTDYFNSGAKYVVEKKFDDGTKLIFEDHHRLLSDYLNLFAKLDLRISFSDECKPTKYGYEDKNWVFYKGGKNGVGGYPVFLLFVLSN